jgi:ribosomal-protein-alanine N-acetyltransferase
MAKQILKMETANLWLRPWQNSDSAALFSYVLNPLVGRAAGWTPPGTDAKSELILKDILTRPDTFIIALKSENYPIGSIVLMSYGKSKLAKSPNEGEVGFWLGQEFWRHGYMTEALTAILEYSFSKKSLDKIWYGYFNENISSQNLAAKFGFRYAYTRNYSYWPALHAIKKEEVAVLTIQEWQHK